MSENKSVPKRDSFNFGDDLCQLILSYLQFYDKFKLEGVCRQWKRLIFNSVRELDVPFNVYHVRGFKNYYTWDKMDSGQKLMISKNLIKKFHFIRELNVSVGCDEEILDLIAEYSYVLRKFQLKFDNKHSIDSKTWIKFAENCGKTLKYISIEIFSELNYNTGMFDNTYRITTTVYVLYI